MARYKEYDYSQGKFIPIHFDKQILPGTFEYTLHYLIDNEIDLSIFDLRYKNDETGAPAYDPAILLKIILYAYSRGITSSRKIAQCCRGEHHLHGVIGGHTAALYDDSGFHLIGRSGDHQIISASVDDVR